MLINGIPERFEDIKLDSYREFYLLTKIYNSLIVDIKGLEDIAESLESKHLIHKLDNSFYTPTMLGYHWFVKFGLEKYRNQYNHLTSIN